MSATGAEARAAAIREHWRKAGHQRPPARLSKRAFQAGQWSYVTNKFSGEWRTADAAQRYDFPMIRARSRELAQNNPYMQGLINASANNILGPNGIHWQSQVMSSKAMGDSFDGPDVQANDIIETGYWNACKKPNYLVSRDLTKRAADRLKLRAIITDGEVFVRTYFPFDNDSGIARQIIESDMCDHDYNVAELPGGGCIRMGIEFDKWGAKTAYYFLTNPPNDYQRRTVALPRERVPADEVRHIYLHLRPGQSRGMPWVHAALLQLQQLGEFEKAAVINARIGASRNVFYTKEYPTGWTAESGEKLTDDGRIVDDLNEGEAIELPYGSDVKMLDTRYPDGEIAAFNECILRAISSGLGMSYATLSNDLSQNSFSSSRVGLNEERNQWAALQQFFIEEDCEPDFEEFLKWALASQFIKLPESRFAKFNSMVFTGRKWPAVNPLQDAAADVLLINNLLKTRSECIRDGEHGGRDPLEVFTEAAADRDALAALKLTPADDPNLHAELVKATIEADVTPPAKK